MSIYKLMQDQKAAAIYASLDTHIHPAMLADDFLQAKLAGDKSLCLALECYVRDLARMHFHRPEVLDALNSIERHMRVRKMGTNAPKALQSIADQIETLYRQHGGQVLDDGRIRFYVTNDSGGATKIICKNQPGAVALVVAKYRRGMPKSRGGRYGTANT